MTYTEFIKEKQRLTQNCNIDCNDCRLSHINNGISESCTDFLVKCPEEAEAIIEQWAKDCPPKPIKTRQSELLKLFPNLQLTLNNCVPFCPKRMDETFPCDYFGDLIGCEQCKKKYWLEEIEEDEK